MKVLFLTEGLTIPASRFRVMQLIPHLEKAGVHCTVRSSYGLEYNNQIGKSGFGRYRLGRKLSRIHDILDVREFDLVFLQRPSLPFAPIFETLIESQDVPMILDVDDAIYLNADGNISRVRQWNMEQVTAKASLVILGNSYLERWFEMASSVEVIPTVVDTDIYKPKAGPAGSRVTIGWMGTSSNFVYLDMILHELRDVLKTHPDVILRIISNAQYSPLQDHPQVEQVRWRADTEVSELQNFTIGIMPLAETLAALGKCAFKAIQYMAVGIPVVASPVGANVEVIDAKSGLLAANNEWTEVLGILIRDRSLGKRMGQEGRRRVVQHYSIEACLPKYLSAFRQVLET